MAIITVQTDFLKKVPGILKVIEVLLGMICIILTDYYVYLHSRLYGYFLVTTVLFFVMTLLIIISCVFSHNTAVLLSQTLFEPLYHALGFVMYFAASVSELNAYSSDGAIAAGVSFIIFAEKLLIAFPITSRIRMFLLRLSGFKSLALINSFLYAASAYFSFKEYKS